MSIYGGKGEFLAPATYNIDQSNSFTTLKVVHSLPHMLILGSSNSAANKDMMS